MRILCLFAFVDPIPCRRHSQKKITVIGAGTLTQVSAAVRPARGDPLKQTSTAKPHPKTCDHPHVSTCGGRGHMKLKKKRCSTTGKAAVDEDGVPCVMGYLPVTEPPSMETLALTPTQPNSPWKWPFAFLNPCLLLIAPHSGGCQPLKQTTKQLTGRSFF